MSDPSWGVEVKRREREQALRAGVGRPTELRYGASEVPAPPKSVTGYRVQYWASWAVLIVAIVTGVLQVADPAKLNVPPAVIAWAGIIASICAGIQTFLPSVRRPPVDNDDPGPAESPDPMRRDT